MDALYFLKSRTAFIRFFYEAGSNGFADVQRRIEESLPPYNDPPYSESGEPAFLDEWLDAQASIDVLGVACVSMLSDSLKLYFETLRTRIIHFQFDNPKSAFKEGFVPAFLEALGVILETDWSDCPADLRLIEQIVLARNRGAHGDELASLIITHDEATLKKHPRPFFVADDELSALTSEDGSIGSLLRPTLKIDHPKLETAIEQVERLAEWIDGRLDRAHAWRMSQRT